MLKFRFVVTLLALTGTAAMAIETPKYIVVQKYADFEVREYAYYNVAETRVEGNRSEAASEAFSRLAGYIFGKNQTQSKLEMTAPVTQAAEPQNVKISMTAPVTQEKIGETPSWLIQFMMPAEFTLETLPVPKDARVTLRQMPARRVAAIRYSGSWSESNYREHLEKLRAGLTREKLTPRGEPIWARYDSPMKPWFLRTNEILLELQTPKN